MNGRGGSKRYANMRPSIHSQLTLPIASLSRELREMDDADELGAAGGGVGVGLRSEGGSEEKTAVSMCSASRPSAPASSWCVLNAQKCVRVRSSAEV